MSHTPGSLESILYEELSTAYIARFGAGAVSEKPMWENMAHEKHQGDPGNTNAQCFVQFEVGPVEYNKINTSAAVIPMNIVFFRVLWQCHKTDMPGGWAGKYNYARALFWSTELYYQIVTGNGVWWPITIQVGDKYAIDTINVLHSTPAQFDNDGSAHGELICFCEFRTL